MPYVALEHIESWTGRVSLQFAESAESQLKRFESGDILFGKLRPYLAKVARANCRGKCVGEFLVLRATNWISEHFLEHLLRSKPFIDWINSSTFGARMPRADWQFVGSTKLAAPPLAEQTTIARFLDRATNRIDRYIRAKEKLIALLDEYRQALIHQAVTGQIDVRTGEPYPAYKPSGVEWLGDLPEHWQARRLGHIGRFSKGNGGTKADERKDGTPCVRYGDIYTQHRFFVRSSRACVAPDLAETAYTRINYGDVLFAASGETIDEIGKSAVNLIDGPACCGGDVIILRPTIEIDPRFLGYAADSPAMVRQKARTGRGFTVMHTYSSALKRLTVAVPPLPEQTAIARFLNETIANKDATIDRTRRQIELSREFRTRLIADVVTGKLDVREAAAELPDTNVIAWKDGVDTIQAESHSRRAEHSIAEEASA